MIFRFPGLRDRSLGVRPAPRRWLIVAALFSVTYGVLTPLAAYGVFLPVFAETFAWSRSPKRLTSIASRSLYPHARLDRSASLGTRPDLRIGLDQTPGSTLDRGLEGAPGMRASTRVGWTKGVYRLVKLPCAYCGGLGVETDHVIARQFFPNDPAYRWNCRKFRPVVVAMEPSRELKTDRE